MTERPLTGPVVVVGRPRSGTRVLAQALRASGFYMGVDATDGYLDSMSWYQRFVVPLVTSRFFPDWDQYASDPAFDRFCGDRLADTWASFTGGADVPPAWGWKYPETLFVMPVVKRIFPTARFVHVIRDGRDVIMSANGYFQIGGPTADPPGWDPPVLGDARRGGGRDDRSTYRQYCIAVTFGGPAPRRWRDINLDDHQALVHNRFLLQMQSWMTCVTAARRHGLPLGADYCEVRYEELCHSPQEVLHDLWAWVGTRMTDECEVFLNDQVRDSRVGAWKHSRRSARERRDFDRAVTYGAPLLRELGYAI